MQINRAGICLCGCGLKTAIADRSRKNRALKGHPLNYIVGHSSHRRVRFGQPGTIWCARCKAFKDKNDFDKCSRKNNNRQSICKVCSGEVAKLYRKTHRAELTAITRKANLKKNYGMTPEDYLKMFNVQRGLCSICRELEKSVYKGRPRRLAVDHDHLTGKIRSLLCSRCNTAVGVLNDNPVLLRAAADYIEKHRS